MNKLYVMSRPPVILTNPVTKESGTLKAWAMKLNLSINGMTSRLERFRKGLITEAYLFQINDGLPKKYNPRKREYYDLNEFLSSISGEDLSTSWSPVDGEELAPIKGSWDPFNY